MNRTWLMLGAALAVTGAALVAQAPVPELAFDTSADFLRTPPDTFIGEVGGVGANSKGQLFVYTRTGHPYATLGDNRTFYRNGSRLFQFDPSGKFVREVLLCETLPSPPANRISVSTRTSEPGTIPPPRQSSPCLACDAHSRPAARPEERRGVWWRSADRGGRRIRAWRAARHATPRPR